MEKLQCDVAFMLKGCRVPVRDVTDVVHNDALDEAAREIAIAFEQNRTTFNRAKFLAECGVEDI